MGFTEPDTPPPPQGVPQMPASSFDIQAPYSPGSPQPISTAGDADAGGRDIVAGTVDGAVANAKARYGELQSDTHGQGSTIGDVYALPPSPLDPGVGSLGEASPSGAYYDPPRDYGG